MGDHTEELCSPVRLNGHNHEPGRVERHLIRPNANGTAICLTKQIIEIGSNDLDNAFLTSLSGREAHRLAHRSFGPFGITAVEFGKSAQVCSRIIDGLARESVMRSCFRTAFLPILAGPAGRPLTPAELH